MIDPSHLNVQCCTTTGSHRRDRRGSQALPGQGECSSSRTHARPRNLLYGLELCSSAEGPFPLQAGRARRRLAGSANEASGLLQRPSSGRGDSDFGATLTSVRRWRCVVQVGARSRWTYPPSTKICCPVIVDRGDRSRTTASAISL